MVRAGCVFVAGIHPSRTRTSGSFWVCAMKCMYAQTRPRFILSSEGVFWGMEFVPMLTPREKSPLPKMSPEEDRTRDTVDSEPKHYQLSYSGPLTEIKWGSFEHAYTNTEEQLGKFLSRGEQRFGHPHTRVIWSDIQANTTGNRLQRSQVQYTGNCLKISASALATFCLCHLQWK